MAWMVDQRHYLDVLDPAVRSEIPAPARRVAEYFGAIVEGVTSGWDDPREGCALPVRCIGKVGRRRCTDHVVARIVEGRSTDDSGKLVTADIIDWVCLGCGDHGEIHHWRETPWNLTEVGKQYFPALDEVVQLVLTLEEFEVIRAIPVLDDVALRVLAAGRMPGDDEVIINAPRGWLEHLVEFIASESNHSKSRKKVKLYDAVLDRAGEVI